MATSIIGQKHSAIHRNPSMVYTKKNTTLLNIQLHFKTTQERYIRMQKHHISHSLYLSLQNKSAFLFSMSCFHLGNLENASLVIPNTVSNSLSDKQAYKQEQVVKKKSVNICPKKMLTLPHRIELLKERKIETRDAEPCILHCKTESIFIQA